MTTLTNSWIPVDLANVPDEIKRGATKVDIAAKRYDATNDRFECERFTNSRWEYRCKDFVDERGESLLSQGYRATHFMLVALPEI